MPESVRQAIDGKIEILRDYGEVPVIHGPYGQLHQCVLESDYECGTGGCPMAGGSRSRRLARTIASYVRIRDTGSGIPERIRNKIFEPFFTTKPPAWVPDWTVDQLTAS